MDRRITVLGVATMGLLAACGGPSEGGSTGGGACDPTKHVCVTERDFAISLDPADAQAGSIVFNVRNQGPSTHELVVIRTDLAADALPVKKGVVDETASGLTISAEQENISPGTSATLTTNLTAGKYALICNIPGHYEAGMHAGFEVR